jgi:serine/threonine-protein phosphatase 6 catalytic subunit
MSGKTDAEVWLTQLYEGKCLSERDLRILCERVKELLIEESNV